MKSAVCECPIEEAMVLLSARWPTLLLHYLQQGTQRFGRLQKDNPNISYRMLTHELRGQDPQRAAICHSGRTCLNPHRP